MSAESFEIKLRPAELPEGCEPILMAGAAFTLDADGVASGDGVWSCGSQHGTCTTWILPIHPLSDCARLQAMGANDPCCNFHAFVKAQDA